MNDPCDRMVTVRQATKSVASHPLPAGSKGPDIYERLAAILGVERHEAKRAVYHYVYGGK